MTKLTAEIDAQALREAADRVGYAASEEALERLAPKVQQLARRYEAFEATFLEAVGVPERRTLEYTAYPDIDPNPNNAWLARFELREAGAGPLAGCTVGLKDNIPVAGAPMTFGIGAFAGFVPDVDAAVVRGLLRAGATIAGKLNMDPFSVAGPGLGGVGDYGFVRNPAAPGRLSGGTSSGAGAAVAAGECDLAIGGDGGGSARIPGAWSGVFALKPTFGVIPCDDVVGSEPTLDHLGLLAREPDLIRLALTALSAVEDSLDWRSRWAAGWAAANGRAAVRPRDSAPLERLRVGMVAEGLVGAEAAVVDGVSNVAAELRELGAEVKTISIPAHRLASTPVELLLMEGGRMLQESALEGAFTPGSLDAGLTRRMHELRTGPPEGISEVFAMRCVFGETLRTAFKHGLYSLAHRSRPWFTQQYDLALEDVDVLLLPTVAFTPPAVPPARADNAFEQTVRGDESEVPVNRETAPFNLTGHPALSLPASAPGEPPVGAQLVGRHHDDVLVLDVAEAVHLRRAAR